MLWLRDTAGRVGTCPVAATGRFGPAGYPVFTGCDGLLQVEITPEGSHRVITRPAHTRVLAAAPGR
ncbi:DUF6296 family protein [Streptomyces sp. CB01881]|uniref:DUF6296 family protein n=1 Tax=Streptomyces sp. CB01881 TaxID=2078691 RepID=UPI0023F95D3F|nr:DUF6296 family protein [Streptomyces sp. CB01881]